MTGKIRNVLTHTHKNLKKNYRSLHYIIFLSFWLFSYSGVCSNQMWLSIYDVIVVQKSSTGDGKYFVGKNVWEMKVQCVRVTEAWNEIFLSLQNNDIIIRKQPIGTYSTVRKGYKRNQEKTNGDYYYFKEKHNRTVMRLY